MLYYLLILIVVLLYNIFRIYVMRVPSLFSTCLIIKLWRYFWCWYPILDVILFPLKSHFYWIELDVGSPSWMSFSFLLKGFLRLVLWCIWVYSKYIECQRSSGSTSSQCYCEAVIIFRAVFIIMVISWCK